MKIALVAVAVPTEGAYAHGPHNISQAKALTEAGAPTVVYCTAPWVPRVLGSLSPKLHRLAFRPKRSEYDGVQIRTIRRPMPDPWLVRRWFSTPLPRATSALLTVVWGRAIDRAIDQQRPELLYINNGLVWGGVARWVARRRGIRYAFIEQNLIRLRPGSAAARFYLDVAHDAAGVFVVGADDHTHLTERLGLAKATLLPNGARRPTAEQWRAPRPDRWKQRRVVLCVGSFVERKGHRELLRAFAEAAGERDLLVIVGDAPPPIRALADELGLRGRVEFTPRVPQQELMQYMVWADLFALVSWAEPFGMVFVEAMGAGTPAIMTQDCGVAPFIERGQHGWIVPPRDHGALVTALRAAFNGADLEAMGAAGRRLVDERFDWGRNAQDFLAALAIS